MNNQLIEHCVPLSFRDQCAIAAMAASISPDEDIADAEEVAEIAFAIADAMEAERKTRAP